MIVSLGLQVIINQLWCADYSLQLHKQDIETAPALHCKHNRTVERPVCLLNQLWTAMESMTEVTSSLCPSYHKLDKLISSRWIPALRQFTTICCWDGKIIYKLPHSLACCSLWCNLLWMGAVPMRHTESAFDQTQDLCQTCPDWQVLAALNHHMRGVRSTKWQIWDYIFSAVINMLARGLVKHLTMVLRKRRSWCYYMSYTGVLQEEAM